MPFKHALSVSKKPASAGINQAMARSVDEVPSTYDIDATEFGGEHLPGPAHPIHQANAGGVVHGAEPHRGEEVASSRPAVMHLILSLIGGYFTLRLARYLSIV